MNDHLRMAGVIAKLLDSQFKIGKFRFGLDPVMGLLPGLGEVIPLGLSAYIIWIAIQMKLPAERIAQMIGNVTVDFLIGLIPVLGDIADFAIKANVKNMEILRQYAPSDILEGNVVD